LQNGRASGVVKASRVAEFAECRKFPTLGAEDRVKVVACCKGSEGGKIEAVSVSQEHARIGTRRRAPHD